MKKIILFLSVILLAWGSYGQQMPSFSQYMFNGLYLNPAYAGSHEYISSSILYRHQWTKLPGAPRTGLMAIDGRLKNPNMGLGFLASYDQHSIVSNTEVYGVYSYSVKLSFKSRLAFGVKVGVSNYIEKLGDLDYWDDDPLLQENTTSRWFPKAGFGIYYYSELFYVGLSVPTVFAFDNRYDFSYDVENSSVFDRYYYLTSGYVIPASDNVVFKPFMLVKYDPSGPLVADFNLCMLLQKRYWLGIGYRTNTSMSAMIEIQVNNILRIGYSYDFLHQELYKYAGGAHEVMLGFDFGATIKKFKNVRYF